MPDKNYPTKPRKGRAKHEAWASQRRQPDRNLEKPPAQNPKTEPDNPLADAISNSIKWATWVIAFSAICSAVIAYYQWGALQHSDQTTRESFSAVQRAFVTGKDLQIVENPILYWFFSIILENTGNTPTKNMEVCFKSGFSLTELNDTIPRKTPSFAPGDPEKICNQEKIVWPFQRIVLAPKGIIPVQGVGIPKKYIEEMAKNRSDGYIYGIAYYDDVFSGSKKHITKFCFVVIPVAEPDGTAKIERGLCQYWNCADDECDADKAAYDTALKSLNPPDQPK